MNNIKNHLNIDSKKLLKIIDNIKSKNTNTIYKNICNNIHNNKFIKNINNKIKKVIKNSIHELIILILNFTFPISYSA